MFIKVPPPLNRPKVLVAGHPDSSRVMKGHLVYAGDELVKHHHPHPHHPDHHGFIDKQYEYLNDWKEEEDRDEESDDDETEEEKDLGTRFCFSDLSICTLISHNQQVLSAARMNTTSILRMEITTTTTNTAIEGNSHIPIPFLFDNKLCW